MSISFERNNAQVFYENLIGVTPEDLLSKDKEFRSHTLTSEEVVGLGRALKEDAKNLFYNGVLSFAEGIDSAFKRRFSWSTVKLYYSIYYLVRASLASKGIAILRCKSMFRLTLQVGESPFATGNKKYNTTHEGTISHYKDLFGNSDVLLSNVIEEQDAYQWMMNAREVVNYKSSAFLEPDCLDIWDIFSRSINDGTFSELLEKLEIDPYLLCFQEEYAVIAIPMKRLQQTASDLQKAGIIPCLNKERVGVIREVIGYDERGLHIFPSVLMARI